jgi:hypothetical protein
MVPPLSQTRPIDIIVNPKTLSIVTFYFVDKTSSKGARELSRKNGRSWIRTDGPRHALIKQCLDDF